MGTQASMGNATKLDAFEFGQHFMVWRFSKGIAFHDRVIECAGMFGIDEEVLSGHFSSNEELAIVKAVQARLSKIDEKFSHWFEIGWTTVFLSNMCRFPPAEEIINAAMRGFRRTLEDVGIHPDERDLLERTLFSMRDVGKQAESSLGKVFERLRFLAKEVDMKEADEAKRRCQQIVLARWPEASSSRSASK